MDITTRRWERVDMVKVIGRVDHQTAPELEKALRSILDEGRHNIVVDMSEISYISSAGLKVLQAMAKAARSGVRPGDVRLVGLSAQSGGCVPHDWPGPVLQNLYGACRSRWQFLDGDKPAAHTQKALLSAFLFVSAVIFNDNGCQSC